MTGEGEAAPFNEDHKTSRATKQNHAVGSAGPVKRRAGSLACADEGSFYLDFIQVAYCFSKAFMCSLRSGLVPFLAKKLRSNLECLLKQILNNEKTASAFLSAIKKQSTVEKSIEPPRRRAGRFQFKE